MTQNTDFTKAFLTFKIPSRFHSAVMNIISFTPLGYSTAFTAIHFKERRTLQYICVDISCTEFCPNRIT